MRTLALLILGTCVLWFVGLPPNAHGIDPQFAVSIGSIPIPDLWQLWNPDRHYELTHLFGIGHYRPLAYMLGGLAHHLGIGLSLNLTFHTLSAWLITIILRRWGVTPFLAGISALIFLFHPALEDSLTIYMLHYHGGTVSFLLSLLAMQAWMARPHPVRLGAMLAGLAASALFVELGLGGAVVLIGCLVAWGRESTERRRAMWGAILSVVVVTVLLTALDVYALTAHPSRLMNMALVVRWKRLFLNLFFEPYWAFLIPHQFPPRLWEWMAVFGSILTLGAAVRFADRLKWPEMVLWLTVGPFLGPTLFFFEMTPKWSSTRMFHEPCALLSLWLGLTLSRFPRRLAIALSLMCCLGIIALSFFTDSWELRG